MVNRHPDIFENRQYPGRTLSFAFEIAGESIPAFINALETDRNDYLLTSTPLKQELSTHLKHLGIPITIQQNTFAVDTAGLCSPKLLINVGAEVC